MNFLPTMLQFLLFVGFRALGFVLVPHIVQERLAIHQI